MWGWGGLLGCIDIPLEPCMAAALGIRSQRHTAVLLAVVFVCGVVWWLHVGCVDCVLTAC